MVKYKPFSFSKLSTFKQCPRKFKYKYIDKLPVQDTDKTALLKGSALHNILEKYPNPGTHKLAPKYQYIFDNFITSKYKSYLDIPNIKEEGIGLSENLEPIPYSNKCLFRGYIDYYTVKDDMIIIIDWKSGKLKEPKWQDYTQLMFYAIYMFQKYKKVQKIQISYVYIEHCQSNDMLLERKYLSNYTNELIDLINNLENSNYEKKKQKLCDYCEYQKFCDNTI